MPNRLSYEAELNHLGETYQRILRWDVSSLRGALLSVAAGPAVFIGTGGTSAVARLAAQLHEQVGGQPSRVATPLEFARLPPTLRSGTVMFSAGASHPDALGVLGRLAASRFRPAVLVTLRNPAELTGSVSRDVDVLALPPLGFSEGFLATNSVLAMMTALVRAYAGDESLPPTLPTGEITFPAADTNELLVLTTPETAPVGSDLETRCAELGLLPVQVTDYRNFAHGRHVGLARRAADTTVLGLVADPLAELANATLDALPPEIKQFAWRARSPGPAGVIELTGASMTFAGELARSRQVNAARPGAAPFGRRLYHLSLRRLVPVTNDGPVARKLVALAAGVAGGSTRARYEDAYRTWSKQIAEMRFGGLVLDYDGTVCATGQRFDLPAGSIQAALTRLLDAGVAIGIATGRGKSIYRDLQAWVPRERWSQVLLGLYNGGVTLTLADELPDLAEPSEMMAAVADRVGALPVADALDVEARCVQVTVAVRAGAFANIGRLAEIIADTLARGPSLPVKVVTSGHSVDIVPATSTKASIADATASAAGRPVIAIGDQGDLGGNDFELLASTPWTLTVDRCSADPTRCWYLDDSGRSGPSLLEVYLRAARIGDNGSFQFCWGRHEV